MIMRTQEELRLDEKKREKYYGNLVYWKGKPIRPLYKKGMMLYYTDYMMLDCALLDEETKPAEKTYPDYPGYQSTPLVEEGFLFNFSDSMYIDNLVTIYGETHPYNAIFKAAPFPGQWYFNRFEFTLNGHRIFISKPVSLKSPTDKYDLYTYNVYNHARSAAHLLFDEQVDEFKKYAPIKKIPIFVFSRKTRKKITERILLGTNLKLQGLI